MENPVIIFGATGLSRLAMEIFSSHEVVIYGVLEDDETFHNTEINNIPIMGSTTDDGYLKFIGKKCEAFIGEENIEKRAEIAELLKERRKVMPVNAIHAKASIAQSAELSHGILVNSGATINANAIIENHVVIHSNATVEYMAEIEELVQVGTGAIIGANAKIGERVMIGAGAIIASGIKVGKNAQIAQGAVVLRDVEAAAVMVGNPAQAI